jgi:hypothetical protein
MNARLLVVALEREPDIVLVRKRTRRVATWRAPGEFLRGGTNSSNPSPSSGESVSREISPSHVEKPGFSRRCAGWSRQRGRERRAWRGEMAPTGGNVSVGPNSSTAAWMRAVAYSSGSGKGKAKHGTLIAPGKG